MTNPVFEKLDSLLLHMLENNDEEGLLILSQARKEMLIAMTTLLSK